MLPGGAPLPGYVAMYGSMETMGTNTLIFITVRRFEMLDVKYGLMLHRGSGIFHWASPQTTTRVDPQRLSPFSLTQSSPFPCS